MGENSSYDENKTVRVARTLTVPMRNVLSGGRTRGGAARVSGAANTVVALMNRGLVHGDKRWTRLGFEVARRVLPGAVPTVDDAHAIALAENDARDIAAAAEHQSTPAYRHFANACRTHGGHRNAIEQLHAEALDEDGTRGMLRDNPPASSWREGSPTDLRDIETGMEIDFDGSWLAWFPDWDAEEQRKVMLITGRYPTKGGALRHADQYLRPLVLEQIAKAWDEAHEEDARRDNPPASNWRPAPDGFRGDLRDIETGVEIRYLLDGWGAFYPDWDPAARRKIMTLAIRYPTKIQVLGHANRATRPIYRDRIAEAWDQAHAEDAARGAGAGGLDPAPRDWVTVSAPGISIQRHTPSGVEIRWDTHPFPWVTVLRPQWVNGAKMMRPAGEFGSIDRAMSHALRHTIANTLAAKAFAEKLAYEEKARRDQPPSPAPEPGSLIDAADIVTRAVRRAQYNALRAVAIHAHHVHHSAPELRSAILNAADAAARELGVPTAGITSPSTRNLLP